MANANQSNLNSTSDLNTDVLYQKLGDRWFAFSIIEDEVFMSPVSEETIHEIKQERKMPEA